MKVVAVTGGIGSGKSVVADAFKAFGADVESADRISHRIMLKDGKAYNEVVKAFSDEILNKNFEIDRKKLASIVFSDKDKLALLNSISHRIIYKELEDFVLNSKADVVCLEIPLLFSAECPLNIDLKVGVSADEEIRINRIIKRDNCKREDAIARMKNQISDDEIQKKADVVIFNNGNLDDVRDRVREIYLTLVADGMENI